MISFNPELFTFRHVLQQIYVIKKPITRSTQTQMLSSVKRYEAFFRDLGVDEPPVSELTEDYFDRWIVWLAEDKRLSPSTVKSKRKDLIALWRFAQARKFAVVPLELRRVPIPNRNPEAWSRREMAMILEAAAKHYRADVMTATILVCWDTCCRISAAHTSLWSRFDPHRGGAYFYESKTRTERFKDLSAKTIEALHALPADRTYLCGDVSMGSRWRWLTDILESAGLPAGKRDKFHKIRRAKYTATVIENGAEAAADHAGHSGLNMQRYYDDKSLHPPKDCVVGLSL